MRRDLTPPCGGGAVQQARYTRHLSVMLLLFLTACAQATSQTPAVSQQELAREQAEQRRILEGEGNRANQQAVAATPQMLSRLKRVGRRVHDAGKAVCQEMRFQTCSFSIALEQKKTDAVNAYTDGKKLVVTPAMMAVPTTDNQLATVLAHEYAHAVMQHPQKAGQNATLGGLMGLAVDTLAGSQGLQTRGMFSKIGAQGAILRYSQGFEREADYVGMYILQRAGYAIGEAPTLWRRMAALNPDGIYTGTTHPTSAERYVLLNKTAQEIKTKQQQGRPLLPDAKTQQ